MLSWLVSNIELDPAFLRRLDHLLKAIQRVYETRGIVSTIAFSKAIRGNLVNYLSGNPHRILGVRLRPSGLPYALGALASDIEHNKLSSLQMRVLMTVLFATRALKGKPEPDIRPIIDPLDKGVSLTGIDIYAQDF